MVARPAISDEHHVLRYIPPSKRLVDHEGNKLGPSAAAFAMRESDKGGLSVTEIEYFGPLSDESLLQAVMAHRESLESKRVSTEAAYAWAKIEVIRSESLVKYGKKIRVVHDPVPGNLAHAEIRHFSPEDLDILSYFASDIFVEYKTVEALNLPQPD